MDELMRKRILNMEPGPELDALVAEHIFKWNEAKRKTGTCLCGRDEWCEICRPSHSHSRYSTDIKEAWQVVEELLPKMVDSFLIGRYVLNNWVATLTVSAENEKAYQVKANTAPEAICKVALLAVMEDVK